MRILSTFLFGFFLLLVSCVPAKKYNDLLEKEKQCSESLEKFKSQAINSEAQAADLKSRYDLASKELITLRSDTSRLGTEYRNLLAKYDKIVQVNEALETSYDRLRLTGAKETASYAAELEAKKLELQRQEDALLKLEKELKERESKLKVQEERLAELNAIIDQQQASSKALKDRVSNALKNFDNKGLTVIEKNGKIYVSLEAKLLFKSGSTAVEGEGRTALVELAKVLESEKDLEIIVEGHTDTDKLTSSVHPKSNWELSVLRATSVIEIMLGSSSMNPQQIMAAGRSEFHPVDAADKAKNRRIEIIISPDLNALFELVRE